MTQPDLDARAHAVLARVAASPGVTSQQMETGTAFASSASADYGRFLELAAAGLIGFRVPRGQGAVWHVTATGRRWLADHATAQFPAAPAKRLVIGRRMRAAVAYVAKHEGCTKYAAGKAVTRPGHQRDGWVIVQRCIDAGLISARKRRDGTTALSVTESGWVS